MRNDKRSAREKVLNFILWPIKSFLRFFIVISVFGLYQYQSFMIDLVASDVRGLELRKMELENRSAALQADVDRLSNINRIESKAREKFGLISSGNDVQHLVIEAWKPESRKSVESDKGVSLAGVQ